MERIDAIIGHEKFRACLEANKAAEADRCFCCHNMEHFLDVARISMLINLEEERGISKDIIYAAALLHDIGKYMQYAEGVPHEIASARLAPEILEDCGFDDKETGVIIDAIVHHRDKKVKEEGNLRGLLYRADKWSRACYACKAAEECNWPDTKKNLQVRY